MSVGKDLRTERRLRRLLAKVPVSRIRYVDHIENHGPALFKHVCKMDLEGIVAKHSSGPYVTEPQKTTWSRLRTGVILRWKAGKNCLSGNDTTCLHPVGTAGI
jgi:hypothetical protein